MTGAGGRMTCEDIDKELKHYVGELMSDNDYRTFVDHLDTCQPCKARVRSMGSFSNQLWELGDIEIPSDLDSTILFQYNQAQKEPRRSKTKGSKNLVIGIVIAIVGIGLFFGWKKIFISDEKQIEEVDDAVIVKTMAIKKKTTDPDPEAEYLYNQLKGMAESLEPVAKSVQPKKAPVKEEVQEKQVLPSVKESSPPAPKTAPPAASNAYTLHWHIPNFAESDIKQLIGTIKMLNIEPDFEDKNFVIFKTIGKRIKTISGGIQFTHKIQLDLPEFIKDGSDLNREVVASISFTGREPTYSTAGGEGNKLSSGEQETNKSGNSLDWHILLVSSDQKAIVDIIHRHRGTVEFTSDKAVVFSMPGARIEPLGKEIQGTGGIFVDFGDTDFGTVSLLGIVNVLIHFPEQ